MPTFLALGFLIGLRHALEPDHVAAVASIATRGGTFGDHARTGALWGVGHALMLLLLGGTCVALGLSVPAALERALEAAVGVMLVGLGVSVFVRMRRSGLHVHAHAHDGGEVHVHAHAHATDVDHASDPHEHEHRRPLRTVSIGALHGLAGSAALVILVGETAQSPLLGIGYIAAFGLGAVVGMTVLAATIALPLGRSARRRTLLFRAFCGFAGVASIALGLGLVSELVLARP